MSEKKETIHSDSRYEIVVITQFSVGAPDESSVYIAKFGGSMGVSVPRAQIDKLVNDLITARKILDSLREGATEC